MLTAVAISGCSESDERQQTGCETPEVVMHLEGVRDDRIILAEPGAVVTLSIRFAPATEGTSPDLDKYYYTLKSSDPGVFAVDADGVVTAVEIGSAVLAIDVPNNTDLSKRIPVVVTGVRYHSLEITDEAKELSFHLTNAPKTTYDLSEQVVAAPEGADVPALHYYSSDPEVATVHINTGEITPVWEGETRVSVKTVDGSNLSAESHVVVTVVKMAELRFNDRFKPVYEVVKGDMFNLSKGTAEESEVRYAPADAANSNLKFIFSDLEVASISEYGRVSAAKKGTTQVRVETTDGTGLYDAFELKVGEEVMTPLDRTDWAIAATSPNALHLSDPVLNGLPESIFDPRSNTEPMSESCMLLIKPGKTYNGVAGPAANEKICFVMDLGRERSFNHFRWEQVNPNRVGYSMDHNITGLVFSGSNDGADFTPFYDSGKIYAGSTHQRLMPETTTCRYVKVEIKPWNDNGDFILVRDLKLNLRSVVFD